MADGALLPSERTADHLQDGSGPAPKPRAAAPPAKEMEKQVLDLLRLLHEIYATHLTFGSTFLFDRHRSRRMISDLGKIEGRVLDRLGEIRRTLEEHEQTARLEIARLGDRS